MNSINDIESQIKFYTDLLDSANLYINEIAKLENSGVNELSQENFKNYITQLKLSGFINISLLDMLVINKNLVLSKTRWEQIHQIRLGYLLIASVIESYNIHAPQLKIESKKNIKLEELYVEIISDLRTFKKNYNYPNNFKKIRNNTIGHIESDFSILYKFLTEINIDNSVNSIVDFMLILYKINAFGTENSSTLKLKVGDKFYSFIELESMKK